MARIGADLTQAAQLLRAGGLVAIPTETVYGLAANGLDAQAVAKIFAAKNRPSFDPLILHLPHFAAASQYCLDIPPLAEKLAAQFSPGPLTFILRKRPSVPDLVTAGHDTVGIRIPNHPLTLALLQQIDFPLAAPSANPFGYISPTTAAHVAQQLGAQIDYILDGGPCTVGLESTIIDLSGTQPKVLRLGGLSLEALEEAADQALSVQTSSSNPKAPGMLIRHYAPKKLLLLQQNIVIPEGMKENEVVLLRFSALHPDFPSSQQFILSEKADLTEAAARLFQLMRELDALPYGCILAEPLPEQGLGRAMNDRLRRAAAGSAPEIY